MAVGLGVGQLYGLDPAQVVIVPRPLAVTGLLREGGLEDQLVRLVVQVVVEIVPQQTVDKHGLQYKNAMSSHSLSVSKARKCSKFQPILNQ